MRDIRPLQPGIRSGEILRPLSQSFLQDVSCTSLQKNITFISILQRSFLIFLRNKKETRLETLMWTAFY